MHEIEPTLESFADTVPRAPRRRGLSAGSLLGFREPPLERKRRCQ